MTVRVSLPWPPSANRIWRAVRIGRATRNIESREYRDWKIRAAAAIGPAEIVRGPYALSVTLTPPDKRRRDLDNLVKPISDALVSAGLVEDDSQCRRLTVQWADSGPVKGGAVVACVEAV